LPSGAGSDSHENLLNGDLILRNNLWWDFGAGDSWSDLVQTYDDGDNPSGSDVIAHLTDNTNNLVNPELGGISRQADGGFDPRLNAGSPALTNAKPMEDDFFMDVAYQGAFSNTDNWLVGWSALDAYGFIGDLATVNTEEIAEQAGYQILPLTPNPSINETLLQWEMPKAANIYLEIVNLYGQTIKRLVNTRYSNGQHQLLIDTSDLTSGTYLIQLNTDTEIRLSRKLVITH